MDRPLRLTIDKTSLAQNWRTLAERAGVPAGAAIKANAYGLGARDALHTLADAGCRDFFVSIWAEAEELGPLPEGANLAVLHGVGPADMEAASRSNARPVLNSVEQVARWKHAGAGRPCDVMIDTGMNRLGLRPEEVGALDGLAIDTLHSHLACADEDHALNGTQLQRFREIAGSVQARRYSLANSAGIYLGRDYSFDLVRPGLALYEVASGVTRHTRKFGGRSRGSKRRSSSAAPSVPARAAGMARHLSLRRTSKRRSSTSGTPTDISVASHPGALPSRASLPCLCWDGFRWI